MSCDCSTLSSCDDCPTPPRGEENPDYGRRYRIAVDPAAPAGDETANVLVGVNSDGKVTTVEIFAELAFETIQERAHAILTGRQDHSKGIFG